LSIGTILVILGIAFVVSAVATPVVSRLARILGVVDQPSERKVNRRPDIPLLGGMAVGLGFMVGMAVAVQLTGGEIQYRGHVDGLLLGATLLIGVGALDDRWGLGALPKLAFQVVAAAGAIYYGFEIGHVTEPFSRTTWWLSPLFVWIVTTLWIVGITNAINLIDGLDGLATGVSAIIGATLTLTCWQTGEMFGVVFGTALVGGLLGFLPFNFSPARIFLGDTGALFIGFSLSLLALEGYKQANVLTFIVPLLALAVPIIDTVLSVFRRLRARKPIFSADRQHMHHRLLETEGSHRSAVLSIYFLTACFCVIALSFTKLGGVSAAFFLIMVVALTVRLLRNLGSFDALPADENAAGREGEGI
jgi:UDP-GlcNAc:undecaprenyl-phosphate GlcNAc-1-phosphate transferase